MISVSQFEYVNWIVKNFDENIRKLFDCTTMHLPKLLLFDKLPTANAALKILRIYCIVRMIIPYIFDLI